MTYMFLNVLREKTNSVTNGRDRLLILNKVCEKENIFFSFEEIFDDESLCIRTKRCISMFKCTSALGRIIFSNDNRFAPQKTNQLAVKCNGLIVDSASWNIISVHIAPFCVQYNLKETTKKYAEGKYKIFPVFDGTVITLYYYNGWTIGTAKGMDMNNMRWFSQKTYLTMLVEIFDAYSINLDMFDKNYSYCLGFKHPDQHLFNEGPPKLKLWFIKRTDLTTLKEYTDIDLNIPCYVATETPPKSFGELIQQNENAFKNFTKNKTQIHYGYILRSADETDILLESTLMKKIRQYLYNINTKKIPFNLDENNRINYIALRAFLNYQTKKLFLILFPEFQAQFKIYNSFMYKVVNRIIQCSTNTNIKLAGNTNVDAVAKTFMDILKHEQHKINMLDPTSKNIIYEYIVDNENIYIFANIFIF